MRARRPGADWYLGGIEEQVRHRRKPVGEPPVHAVGDILGPVGADLVAERHPGDNDEMVRPEVHGAQVEKCVNALGIFDFGSYYF